MNPEYRPSRSEGDQEDLSQPKESLESLRAERDTAIRAAQDAVYNTTRLTRLLTILSEPAPLPVLLDRLLTTLSELFSADVVALLDPVGTGSFIPLAAVGLPEDLLNIKFYEDNRGYLSGCMETRSVIPISSARADPKIEPQLHAQEIETAVWVPVAGSSSPRGALLLARCNPTVFSNTDIALLTTMSYRIGLVLEQSQHSNQIEQVEQFSRKLNRYLNQQSICDEAVQNFHKLIGADATILCIIENETGDWLITRNGIDSIKDQDWKGFSTHCFSRKYFLSSDPLYIAIEELTENKSIQSVIRKLVAIPLLIGDMLKGIFYIVRFSNILFDPDALRIAQLFAAQTTSALENARLYQTAREEIVKRKQVEEVLENLAFQDGLTGLTNRAFFVEKLQASLNKSKINSESVALIFLDMDDFKVINDSLGHETGDEVLKVIAKRISSCLRANDTAARLGGDEFTVLIENIRSTEQVIAIANRLLFTLKDPIVISGRNLYVNCSMGIAISNPQESDSEELLHKADQAMYEAKNHGKSCYTIYDDNISHKALARLEFESDLKSGLQRKEFQIYYQPIFSLPDRRIVKVEALLRWNHPEKGLLSPFEIIPMAEETGHFMEIGNWVLQESCRQIKTWTTEYPDHGNLSLCMNLSAQQIQFDSLAESISHCLIYNDLDPSKIIFEITEEGMVRDSGTTLNKLLKIRNLGTRLAIDDFGVEYANMEFLKKIPLDVLKIDRSFIHGIGKDKRDEVIIKSMVQLGKAFNLEVIGEGIESEEQLVFLSKLGCDQGQGRFFAPPSPADVIETYFLQKNGADLTRNN